MEKHGALPDDLFSFLGTAALSAIHCPQRRPPVSQLLKITDDHCFSPLRRLTRGVSAENYHLVYPFPVRNGNAIDNAGQLLPGR